MDGRWVYGLEKIGFVDEIDSGLDELVVVGSWRRKPQDLTSRIRKKGKKWEQNELRDTEAVVCVEVLNEVRSYQQPKLAFAQRKQRSHVFWCAEIAFHRKRQQERSNVDGCGDVPLQKYEMGGPFDSPLETQYTCALQVLAVC